MPARLHGSVHGRRIPAGTVIPNPTVDRSATLPANQRAVVLMLCRQVETGRLTPAQAAAVLDTLGLTDTAHEIAARRQPPPGEVPR